MKKAYIIIASVFLVGFLAACGANGNDNNGSTTPPNDANQNTEVDNKNDNTANNSDVTMDNDNQTTENDNAGSTEKVDMNEKMGELDFAEIELQIDYGHDQEYDAQVEKRSTGDYKAEIEDELNNTYLKGDEAFNELYPILETLDITADSSKDEVFSAVLKAFNLEDNYEEIEVEITFHDGTKLEYED